MSKLTSIDQAEPNNEVATSIDWMGRLRNELKEILNPDMHASAPNFYTETVSDKVIEKEPKAISQVEDSVLGKYAFINPKYPLF